MTTRTLNRIIKAHTRTLNRQERIHDRFWRLNSGKATEEAVVKAWITSSNAGRVTSTSLSSLLEVRRDVPRSDRPLLPDSGR
ncbi:MAG: hypothetical protein U1F43_26300 [Myxococcota bacterium]